ncbi:MAG: TIGR01458 family HAD-type hydrolase [Leptospiraceae bacterium]|nr:TIGR01458 family HAD-type hydrolase [Leptospiraceae bacterium]
MEALLIDLNGVLYVDDALIPGAVEAIETVRAKGIPCRFTTNSTTRSLESLHQNLIKLGLPIEREEILSPSYAAVLYLRSLGNPACHLIVAEDTKKDFAEFAESFTRPDVIVIGDIGERWNYPIMNKAFEMVMYGAKIVALHKGKYWQVGNDLKLDIGAFISGLEYATGREALVIGKPSRSFFEMALTDLKVAPDRVIMIGDDIDSDVGGAQQAGMRGVLVKTGKYRPELVARSGIDPDGVLDSIADIETLFR